MPFVKGDKNINRNGRPTIEDRALDDKPTRRQLKDKELLTLLRKIKPHMSDAILKSVHIMQDNSAAHQNQLRAATMILDLYRKLVMDLYDGEVPEDEDENVPEIQRTNPKATFSLTVVKDEDK